MSRTIDPEFRNDPEFRATAEESARDIEIERDERIGLSGSSELAAENEQLNKQIALLDRRIRPDVRGRVDRGAGRDERAGMHAGRWHERGQRVEILRRAGKVGIRIFGDDARTRVGGADRFAVGGRQDQGRGPALRGLRAQLAIA